MAKMYKLMTLGLCACLTIPALIGCKEEGPAEKAGKQMDQAVEEAAETMEEAGEKVKEKME